MIPMIDSAMPGLSTMVLTVGPAALGFLVALAGGVGWMVAGTAAELRREREPGTEPARLGDALRLAA